MRSEPAVTVSCAGTSRDGDRPAVGAAGLTAHDEALSEIEERERTYGAMYGNDDEILGSDL